MKAWISTHRAPFASAMIAVAGAMTIVTLQLLGIVDIPAWWQSLGVWWGDAGWPWVSAWLVSPGFGGFAAVVAASLAFGGSRHQARLNAWWQRVEWALNLYVKPDATSIEREAGAAAVVELQTTRLARRADRAFLAEVARAVTFDPNGDGLEQDDWADAEARDEAEHDALLDANAEGRADAEREGSSEDEPSSEAR